MTLRQDQEDALQNASECFRMLQNASKGFKVLQNASTSLNMLENASGRQEITIMYPFGRTAWMHCLGVEIVYG